MHIAEGALSAPVLAGGAAMAAAGVAVSLRRMDYDHLPKVAVLSATFFVASLIHFPIGPTSFHLILNGLIGLILGWAAFPALLVALFLQSILFGFGGLTALGVNTVTFALPALACYYLFNRPLRRVQAGAVFGLGFAAGAVATTASYALLVLSLYLTDESFSGIIKATLLAHLPLMAVEGLVTGAVIAFLHRVRPELLMAPLRLARAKKMAQP